VGEQYKETELFLLDLKTNYPKSSCILCKFISKRMILNKVINFTASHFLMTFVQ